MTAGENRVLARRFLEAQARGDLEALDAMLAPDFIDRSLLPGQGPTREDYMRSVAEILATFSNVSLSIEDQIVEGDKVATRYTGRSVHRGEFMGASPTGEEADYSAIHIHRIAAGKIVEEWSETDLLSVMLPALEREIGRRARIEEELRVAQRIQQSSLPTTVPTLEGWQLSPHYRPARSVGGDFYDFQQLPGGRLGIVLGDATGKGVPAALIMSTTCGMLRLAAQNFFSPGTMLQQTNEALLPNMPSNTFVTCFYAILDPGTGTLNYANAGHDLPYLYRGGEARALDARGVPLGLMPGMSYEEDRVTVTPGDSVLFYSDGLVEAHDPRGEMFGFPRLRSLVAEHGKQPSLGDLLLGELYSFTGTGWEQEDDITLLTLRRSNQDH